MSTGTEATVERIRELFRERGGMRYGVEAVTQLQHALQSASLARKSGASSRLVVAALLHDIGHLLPESEAGVVEQHGLDDAHEHRGFVWVAARFPAEVADPIRLHVAAKRYLCTVDGSYRDRLSPTSLQSFLDQGGEMSPAELAEFEREPGFREALLVRRWDDTAKESDRRTPELDDFLSDIREALRTDPV
ncbi:MAG: HD domain-containing protein [Pirellulales bacterium]